MNETYNQEFFHKIIINLIKVSPDLKSNLQSNFPESYADIESAATNPHCSCIGRVEKKLLENKAKSLIVLNDFISKNQGDSKIKEVLKINYAALSPQNYSGKIFVIPNNKEKFTEFVESVYKNRGVFRGFSTVVDSDNNLHIYFI
jgi:hypothetical protein